MKQQSILDRVLSSDTAQIRKVMDNADRHEVQILFTTIERSNDGITFTDTAYALDESRYFYPASTVKLPFALLALEKLGRDDRVDMNTPFKLEGDEASTTFANEIRKIFAVSDNEAANRMFEYLGQDAIQQALDSKGVGPSRLSHRLSAPDSGNTKTRDLIFATDTGPVRISGSTSAELQPLQLKAISKGVGYYSGGELVEQPMDFSYKNYLPVPTLHEIMKRVIFPEAYPAGQRFDLSGKQRQFILEAMSALPREAGYDPEEHWDGYVKFFIYGDTKEQITGPVKIFNKVGNAYGYLTDTAYILDLENGVEFLLTATVHVNENRIFNDDHYEYDQTGMPFLAEFGRQIYAAELKRVRNESALSSSGN